MAERGPAFCHSHMPLHLRAWRWGYTWCTSLLHKRDNLWCRFQFQDKNNRHQKTMKWHNYTLRIEIECHWYNWKFCKQNSYLSIEFKFLVNCSPTCDPWGYRTHGCPRGAGKFTHSSFPGEEQVEQQNMNIKPGHMNTMITYFNMQFKTGVHEIRSWPRA